SFGGHKVPDRQPASQNADLETSAILDPEAATQGEASNSQLVDVPEVRNSQLATRHSQLAPPWHKGFATALLAPLFVVLMGNLDGFAQILRSLAKLGDANFQSAFGGLQTVVNAGYGLRAVLAGRQEWPGYNYWEPSRVIPGTINEFPYWSFLFADLHPHLIGIPLAGLFLALTLVLISDYAVNWRQAWRRGVALLATFALLLGALSSVNLWELPTYFGLGVLAFLVSQYRGWGKINWLLTLGVTVGYTGGAYLLFRPFFQRYENIGASGIGLVKAGDDLSTWLLIWGFLAFVLLSWLFYTAAQPARRLAATAVRTLESQPTGCERWLSLALRRFDRLPRLLYLHERLVQPQASYLIGLAILPLALLASLGSWLLDRSVLALCLLGLGLAVLLLWRRGRQADASSLFVALLTATGLALLAGTQVIFLKDFLGGGDFYRMNTLFKFFSQTWVIWGVAAAIALPQMWSGLVRQGRRTASRPVEPAVSDDTEIISSSSKRRSNGSWGLLRAGWSLAFLLLLLAGLAFPAWGTLARITDRFPGWRPAFGTLNGLDYMRQGVFTLPATNTPFELHYDRAAIQWLLDRVRGNLVIVESADIEYYRAAGTRAASMTGLSGLSGLHAGEQRYGEEVGQREALLNEFWTTPDEVRTRQLIDELQVALIYVGQLERDRHPEGVQKIERMAAGGALTPVFQNARTIIYAVPGRLVQNEAGLYFPGN
ncbi:MAG: DUF2298 domain-containing protein, partial [Chloroflexota bacterium]|nr:DUF2298 domain-containing protein [Chloroflexota bacterium]